MRKYIYSRGFWENLVVCVCRVRRKAAHLLALSVFPTVSPFSSFLPFLERAGLVVKHAAPSFLLRSVSFSCCLGG